MFLLLIFKGLQIFLKTISSAYNFLSYYELYKSLPNHELRARLKEMPHKAAYVLAARKGDISKKTEVIEKYSQLRADEILLKNAYLIAKTIYHQDKTYSYCIWEYAKTILELRDDKKIEELFAFIQNAARSDPDLLVEVYYDDTFVELINRIYALKKQN